MRRSNMIVFVWLGMLVGFAAAAANAAEDLKSLIQKVDAKLYYPQTDGLRSLQADVESSLLADQLKNAPEAKDVKLVFWVKSLSS